MKNSDSHGGNIYNISKKYNIKSGRIIDYSINLNPSGFPKCLKKNIIKALNMIDKYPDPDYEELTDSLSDYRNISREYILPGNGAAEIIYQFIKILTPSKTLIIQPTFTEYERALKSAGCETVYFKLDEKDDFHIDIQKLKKELLKKYDLLVICNPNNPTGKLYDKNLMFDIVKAAYDSETFVMIDESFMEFTDEGLLNSFTENVSSFNNVFIVSSLTKYFSIPGLRLGYGITFNHEIIEKYNSYKLLWSINCFASSISRGILKDKRFMEYSKKILLKEKKFIYENICLNSAVKIYNSDVNFFLIKLLNGMNGAFVKEKMLAKGILVRDCSNFHFLDDSFIRIGIKDRRSNLLMLNAFSGVVLPESF